MTETEPVAQSSENGAVVVATDVTRRYGDGDTAVDALRGVSVDVRDGKLTAVMGPSGLGQVDAHAHPRRPRQADRRAASTIAGTEITTLGDNDLTKLRREHIGFVFQFFNLLPMLTAEENILLPLTIAGEKPDHGWFDELIALASASTTGSTTARPSSPAASSSVSRSRARSSRARSVVFADEPTGNLDSKTSGEILELLRHSVRRPTGRRSSWSPTTRAPPRSPTACSSSPTGCIVREVSEATPHDIVADDGRDRRRSDPVRAQGHAGPQAAHGPRPRSPSSSASRW